MPLLPVPLPDELISSVISRGAREYGLSSKRQIQDVYGDNRSYFSFLFSDSLHRIAMLSGQAPERLLLKHTVFPYATAFMSEEVREELVNHALTNTARGRMNFVSARVSVGTTYRRLCSRCVNDDLQTLGTSYWRVSHQLPLASHCLVHDIPLEYSDIALHRNANCRDIKLPHETNIRTNPQKLSEGLTKDLNDRSYQLLCGKKHGNWQAAKYREAAMELGFLRPSGTLAARALCNEFQTYFGPEYLASVGCPVLDSAPWPALLCSETKQTEVSTTKHILFETFLSRYRLPSDRKLIHYKPRIKRHRDYGFLDAQLSQRLVSKFGEYPLANADLKISEVLSELDARSLYSHHRAKLPLTARWIDSLKTKGQKHVVRSD